MDHDRCYVFKPPESRPTKRQRVNPTALDASRSLRVRTYQDIWGQQQERFQGILNESNRVTLDEVVKFISESSIEQRNKIIPTGFILVGPDTTSHDAFFQQLSDRIAFETSSLFSLVNSSEATNLKALLKTLIQKAASEHDSSILHGGARLLDYDLQLLLDKINGGERDQIVVAFPDSESFDASLVGDIIELLSSWSDRIPVILLFGIATSVEIFQDRLPRSAVRFVQGRQFDVVQSNELVERIFRSSIESEEIALRIGPALGNVLLQRQREHMQSPQNFIDSLQYAYMSHFFANPLSIFLRNGLKQKDVSREHLMAIRNTPSFRRHVDGLLKSDAPVGVVRGLLDSDSNLFQFVSQSVRKSQHQLSSMTRAVRLICLVRKELAVFPPNQFSSLYLRALEGELHKSATIKELLLTVRKLPSNALVQLLSKLETWTDSASQQTLGNIRQDLNSLLDEIGDDQQPLRSRYDVRKETLRTTVVAQKVELSRHKENVSKTDAAYSKVLDEFHEWLKSYIEDELSPIEEYLFSEILIYDTKGPDRAAFMPKHRFAVERALSSPHDYLNCECCAKVDDNAKNEAALSGTQPSTALLYQLYLESGSSINVHDLWSAFNAIMNDDEDDTSDKTMFLFQQALAELRYLGLVKSTRKKMDHIAKVSWRGL